MTATKRKIFTSILSIILVLQLFALVSEAFAWEIERPSMDVAIDRRVENATTDGKATVGLGVHIYQYIENHVEDGDYLDLRVSMTADTRMGLDYSIWNNVGFSWIDITGSGVNITYQTEAFISVPAGIWFYGGTYYGILVYPRYGCVVIPSDFEGTPISGPYNKQIPHIAKPNSFIAPFWRELDPLA